ncbi:predicted protein [Sclerotinia sclerotiorum 1980 UF-70]|uniref:Uncharacterized protein n=1 Tax=Sclerotinia sclerotiorum (strain ATCC 18683 / 1980 / Ss-1) TaxID=665079 RepID=A7EJY9_SCLS1|nr:predicted protein [Sclerotinia sclerotiorum 1980 UF-70]EDO03155.1 predicted protein [Sclerotinia sclerotiorum 1980 UF-70]
MRPSSKDDLCQFYARHIEVRMIFRFPLRTECCVWIVLRTLQNGQTLGAHQNEVYQEAPEYSENSCVGKSMKCRWFIKKASKKVMVSEEVTYFSSGCWLWALGRGLEGKCHGVGFRGAQYGLFLLPRVANLG